MLCNVPGMVRSELKAAINYTQVVGSFYLFVSNLSLSINLYKGATPSKAPE
jgi:hypothetical protein